MSKEFSNYQVSEYLSKIAIAYEIKGKDRFRIMAYQNAAETILNYPEKLYDLWRKDPKNLDFIPHIGPSILKKIDYLFKTGKSYPSLKKIFVDIHPAVFTFEKINGIDVLIVNIDECKIKGKMFLDLAKKWGANYLIPVGYKKDGDSLKKFLDEVDEEGLEAVESLKIDRDNLPDGLEVIILQC